MKVWVVLEINKHDEPDCTDGKEIIGIYEKKADAISLMNKHYEDELLGRELDESDESVDIWLDHNGAYIRDDEDASVIAWAIEPHEVY